MLQKVATLEALESSPSSSGAFFDARLMCDRLSALQTIVDKVGTRLSDTQDADHLQERVAALEIAWSEWDVHNGSNADLECASQVFSTLMGSSSHAHVFHRDCGLNKERLRSHSVDSKLRRLNRRRALLHGAPALNRSALAVMCKHYIQQGVRMILIGEMGH